jgi:hypothetical protein
MTTNGTCELDHAISNSFVSCCTSASPFLMDSFSAFPEQSYMPQLME